MTRKRVALEHPIKGVVDLILWDFPRDECAIGKIGREQSLPDATNCSRAQHGRDARHDKIDIHAGALRDFLEWLAHETLDLVLETERIFALMGSSCSTGNMGINPPVDSSCPITGRRCEKSDRLKRFALRLS